jgi:hypothetical protein
MDEQEVSHRCAAGASLVTVGAKRLLVGKRMSRRSWALAVGSGFADRVLSCIEERSG